MKVKIGRLSGPSTDVEAQADFNEQELEVVKDVLAMVNTVTNERESWYLTTIEEGHL